MNISSINGTNFMPRSFPKVEYSEEKIRFLTVCGGEIGQYRGGENGN